MMPGSSLPLDRNLALEVVRVTEASALAAARWIGRGDEKAADEAAARAMRDALDALCMAGEIVNGDGDDPARPLATGRKVGNCQGPRVDVALMPLEGPTVCAKGSHNALSVVAMAEHGAILRVPEGAYMEKIATGPGVPADAVDLDLAPEEVLARVAAAKKVRVSDLTVSILDRPRHSGLIGRLFEAGARVILFDDGDMSGALSTGLPDTGIDLYMGSGGALQGVLAAAGLKCLGGRMQCRFMARGDEQRLRLRQAGIDNADRKYDIDDIVAGDVMFAATGVTDGHVLKGIRLSGGKATSHSLVMRSLTGTFRLLTAYHDLSRSAS